MTPIDGALLVIAYAVLMLAIGRRAYEDKKRKGTL